MTHRALVLTTVPTHPINAGNRLLLNNYLNVLGDAGVELFLLYVNDGKTPYSEELMYSKWTNNLFIHNDNKYLWKKRFYKYYRSIFNKPICYDVDDWYPTGLSYYVDRIIEENDVTHLICNYVWMTKVFITSKHDIKKILITHDSFADRNNITKSRWFSTSESEELNAISRSDYVWAVQETEANHFKKQLKSEVITAFCPYPQVSSDTVNRKTILFLGSDNPHNVKSLLSWIMDTYSIIVKRDPSISLLIGGGICECLEKNDFIQNIQGVKLHGTLKSPSELYVKGNLVINPITEGTGIKIKTIEALAYNKVLFTDAHNIEGLPHKDKLPVVLFKEPSSDADAIINLLNNMEQVNQFKQHAEEYMREYNSIVQKRLLIPFNG